MSSQHHVSELVAINDTKSRPKLRPEFESSWDHVGTKSGPSRDQVIFQSTQSPTQPPTQLHKIPSPHYCIKSVTEQVTEQVSATKHRGHIDTAAKVKSTAKVTAGVSAKVSTYPGASNT